MSKPSTDPRHEPDPPKEHETGAPPQEDEGEFQEIEHGPPRGARLMAVIRWTLVGVMAVLAIVSVLYYFGKLPTASAQQGATVYYCPMHPGVKQDHPGDCPICSMTLVPKEASVASAPISAGAKSDDARASAEPYACPMHPEQGSKDANARCPLCKMRLEPNPRHGGGDVRAAAEGGTDAGNTMGGAMSAAHGMDAGLPKVVPVDLAPERVQLIGMRTAKVTRGKLVSQLRTVGVISATEDGLARVHTRFAGWIQRLDVTQTGQRVSRGQVLATVYSPQVLVAEQELFAARRWGGALPAAAEDAGTKQGLDDDARQRLELLGIAAEDIAQIEKTGKPQALVKLRSPANGYVFQKNAVAGLYFQPGVELFTIADLSRVWVLAEVYENEIARVKLGQAAKVQVQALNRSFEGTVKFIYPSVSPTTRTMRVRIELANREGQLRPGMFGDVLIDLPEAGGLVVPGEALVDTGEHQYVYVAREGGRFEPRAVTVGVRAGGNVEILRGLSEGETVVTTGNFLIDSESRLRAVIDEVPQNAAGPGQGPGCDTDFDRAKFPDKFQQCRSCEVVHGGMGNMEQDCKNAIPKPWR